MVYPKDQIYRGVGKVRRERQAQAGPVDLQLLSFARHDLKEVLVTNRQGDRLLIPYRLVYHKVVQCSWPHESTRSLRGRRLLAEFTEDVS